MLGLAIRASFLLKKGAGGYSIAPLLHLQPLLCIADSLGLRILNDFSYSACFQCSTPNDFESLMDCTVQQLQHAFDLQEATPLDLILIPNGELSLFDVGATPFPYHPVPSHR